MTSKPTPSFKEDPVGWLKKSPAMIWHFCVHMWTGFKLLALNIGTAVGILYRVSQGKQLTRREHRLLVTVASDIFRMVPFTFFIIIPAAELLLPFFLKLFPNMLPSTFTSVEEKEEKYKKLVQARVMLAQFLSETSEGVKNPSSTFQGNFQKFLREVSAGGPVSQDQILNFIRTFKDDLTLDNLKRSQLMQMCRFIGIQPYGPTNLLRFRLNARIDDLLRDDKMIQKEGIASLSLLELKSVCAARGMDSSGSRTKLEELLKEWLHLSLELKVPPALLILSRAFRFYSRDRDGLEKKPDHIDSLADTIRHMPPEVIEEVATDVVMDQAIAAGDLPAKLEILKEERAKIKEELEEQQERQEEQASGEVAGDIDELTAAVSEEGIQLEMKPEQTETLVDLEEQVLEMNEEKPATKVEQKIKKKLESMLADLEKDREIIEEMDREIEEKVESLAKKEKRPPTVLDDEINQKRVEEQEEIISRLFKEKTQTEKPEKEKADGETSVGPATEQPPRAQAEATERPETSQPPAEPQSQEQPQAPQMEAVDKKNREPLNKANE